MATGVPAGVDCHGLTDKDRAKKPWKFIGYRAFCKFVASDDDFFVLRRFSVLTSRVLLSLQDELSELQSKPEAVEEDLMAFPARERRDQADAHEPAIGREA